VTSPRLSAPELSTPALIVDGPVLESNIVAMAHARPGLSLRPHVKAFKTTALARRLAVEQGHLAFCAATLREMEGMVEAGLAEDLLLANETLDSDRLGRLLRSDARITVAVDSEATIAAASRAGTCAVLIDVNVGLPRCGCPPGDAGRLADLARTSGLEVRGVMGYEGHCQDWDDVDRRRQETERSMALLGEAHEQVGGDVVSGGGTGTCEVNRVATEIQAGSYLLMDTHYARLADLPFRPALAVLGTVISVTPGDEGWYVLDAGLKSLGMDHGDPTADHGTLFFCSDEHTTVLHHGDPPAIGDRLRLWPAHVDPTVAKHPVMVVVDGDEIVDRWEVDLRDW
jgi:D-serine deaminase-like pyridoxal phosphate-dependent protein